MLLAIDVGNTNMVFGIFEGAELKGSFRVMTVGDRTSDELGLLVCQYFQRFGLELGQVEDVREAAALIEGEELDALFDQFAEEYQTESGSQKLLSYSLRTTLHVGRVDGGF